MESKAMVRTWGNVDLGFEDILSPRAGLASAFPRISTVPDRGWEKVDSTNRQRRHGQANADERAKM
ncbi:hypothetical protein N7509_007140 [Penicillium cosmopolitanum]|uniref:Uncharacterized protein n=1 Tax=Penicillium cosmopolitanum TaxID=1131564 RepID=A0A9W9VYT3_9EURO|nr:uncharacterized protein N7509_007140 [Penicillium cosmopolitanum]KAJ5391650.1 hypothetical protein N7509_007140 [Penicillium cosmopolitanum]